MLFDKKSPGKEIKKYVKENMYDIDDKFHTAIIIVYHGYRATQFAHAATFVRCTH